MAKYFKSFQPNLTHAYMLALFLIACSMIYAHNIATNHVKKSVNKATVINIAGMQRMLSQRVGLLAREIVDSEDYTLSRSFEAKFAVALDQFTDNHRYLVGLLQNETSSKYIEDLYAGEFGVDARSLQFIALAEAFLIETRSDKRSEVVQNDLMIEIVTIARNGFLQELDSVVKAYEKISTDSVQLFERIELAILCIGLMLLLLEALFIFRPMVRKSLVRQKQLERSNRELTEFSFRVSHDLRSPVASCRGMVEIVEDAVDDKDFAVAAEVTQRMGRALEKLDVLIGDIIAVTRNNVSSMDADHERVNIKILLTDTLEELSALPNFDKCKIELNVSEDLTPQVQKLYLQQIVQNLLSNAIKYANVSETSHTPTVSISSSKKGKKVKLVVDDNGLGIPESCREKVFGMFMRFHPKISQGSGLGLYLTKQNAFALGGDLQYQPLTRGSRFLLSFESKK